MEASRARRGESGFTLIELMVVVLIIAVLLALGIPTFLGARDRANARAAQSNLRNANTSALVVYADNQRFTDDPLQLEAVDGSALRFTNDLTAVDASMLYVLVPAAGTFAAGDTIYLAARAVAGPCYWVRTVGDRAEPRFAENDCAAVPASGAFSDEW